MMNVVKRVLPFLVTLVVGVFLGSLFSSVATRYELSAVRSYSYSNGSGYRYGRCPQHNYSRESYLNEERTSETSSLDILFKPSATYTDAARRNEFEGTVRLLVEFRKDGKIGEIQVLQGQPYGLTDEAIEAAQNIRFNPARKNGEAVTTNQTVEYRFSLTSSSF